jgi:transcriptional regulator with XRE-family HTH domain
MTIEQARGYLGWGQSELARRAGESVSNIRDLENGENKNPSWGLVYRVTCAFQRAGLKKIKPEDLFPVADRESRATAAPGEADTASAASGEVTGEADSRCSAMASTGQRCERRAGHDGNHEVTTQPAAVAQ